MTATAMSMPFSSASAITEQLLNAPGHEHSRMKTKLMSYLDTDRGDRVNLPAPALLRRIANAVGCGTHAAALLVKSREDTKLRTTITFQPNPATVGDLVLWDVVHDFFVENGRGKSEKSAWNKAIWGYKSSKRGRVAGLADEVGEIPALAAFYMLSNGMSGVNRVMNIAGWTWEYVKELLTAATRRIHCFLKDVGNTLLKILEKGSHGMMFAVSLMGALVTGKKAKKITKVQKVIGVDAAASNDDEDENDENDDNFTFENAHPDPDNDPDLQDEDSKAAAPDGFDDPEAVPIKDQDNVDEDDPDEPPKTPRAVAFHLLESTRMSLDHMKSRSPGDQRLIDLLNLVDQPGKMVGALQKDTAGPMDAQISQRMADCLALAWQWAHRTGIFTEIPRHQKYLDMPPRQFLSALITGVRGEYLSPDETPKLPKPKPKKGKKREPDGDDPGREWLQVMDWETGRVARVTRNTPPGADQGPGTIAKIKILGLGDDEIRAIFLHHVKMNMKPKKRKSFNENTTRLRFWVATSMDGSTQVITCELEKHLPKKSIEHQVEDIDAVPPLDGWGSASEATGDIGDIHVREDLISFPEWQTMSKFLKLPPTVIKAGLAGDDEAMGEVHKAIQALSPAERADAQDMVVRMLRLDQEDFQEACADADPLLRLTG